MRKAILGLAAVSLLGLSSLASATTITCPGSPSLRNATFTNVESCYTTGGVTGTPGAGDVLGYFPGDPWSSAGAVTTDGTDQFLTVELTSGSWGQNAAGNWYIDSSFWSTYGEAVLTMHVGNGNGDPDWWFFGVTPGATAGTFSYTNTGNGGGLSNIFLWGRGEGTQVPEPTSLALLGLGLAGLGFVRRRRA